MVEAHPSTTHFLGRETAAAQGAADAVTIKRLQAVEQFAAAPAQAAAPGQTRCGHDWPPDSETFAASQRSTSARRHAVQRVEIFTGLGNRPWAVSDQIWLRDIRIAGDKSATRQSGGKPSESTGIGSDMRKLPKQVGKCLAAFRPVPCGGAARMAFAFVRRRLAALVGS